MANPINLTVGHADNMSIAFFDTDGNPMLVTPTPASPPTWSDVESPAGDATLAVSASGLTAALKAQAAGTDTVTALVVVNDANGNPQTFTDTLVVSISAAPQTLGSIQIVSNVV